MNLFWILIIFGIGFIVGACWNTREVNSKMKFLKNNNATLDEQVQKCNEEMSEFISGINKMDAYNIIEEFFDVIQAMLHVIKLLNLKEELKHGLKRHNKKLKNRGWKFEDIK